MLKKISLKNVRSYKHLKDLEIKPITILCGTNSSGKSTILKSLLLWKQTLENLAYTDGFLLNGKYTNLGTQDNFLHNNARSKVITFNFQFEYETASSYSSFEESTKYLDSIIHSLARRTIPEKTLDSADLIRVDFTLGYKINVKNKLGIDIKDYILKITTVENNDAKKSPPKRFMDSQDSNNMELKISSINKNKIKVEWENIVSTDLVKTNTLASKKLFDRIQNLKKGTHIFPTSKINFENIIKLNLSAAVHFFDVLDDEDYDYETFMKIDIITQQLENLLTETFSRISYLGPLREEPSRRYFFDDQVKNIGVKGENSAFLYNKYKEDYFDYQTFDPINEELIKHSGTLEEVVREWLDEIGILDFDSVKSDELYRFSLSSSEFNEERVNIADVGFGVSQVVPIVIAGLLMEKGETLILEQPEIHLHPKMQMKLADFILSMVLSGKNLIIETHSEHIINRLVRRIVEDGTGRINSLIGINFVKNTEKGSKIETVNLSEKNGIENWPEEFFDQAFAEQQNIMNAIINNKKKNK